MSGKCVLITGGTGSFGSTMVRQLLTTDVREIRVFSRDEAKQDAMRHQLADSRIRFYIGDIRFRDSLDSAMVGVDYVFHAAALKQVPSCEFFPMEAVRTNVTGSKNVIEVAEQAGVTSVVCLSTDKAVYPVNAMGMSKAMMEKIAQAHARSNPHARTVVSCVRYGNVMYSRGSVIPLFIQQLKAGKKLTLTEPSMTRFMMSLSESVDLVQFAFDRAEPGDIFIQRAPSATVQVLAEAICDLFAKPREFDVIGTRSGEKSWETLATREEILRAEDFGTYLRIPLEAPFLNYEEYFTKGKLDIKNDYDSEGVDLLDVEQMKALLLTLAEVRSEMRLAGIDVPEPA
ncbi:polysaccharide biosynthesis protein [Micrococcales bacterium 31B]|nr:polysaccharide biosynthesis protein [Micrococcales bacterium 31B]